MLQWFLAKKAIAETMTLSSSLSLAVSPGLEVWRPIACGSSWQVNLQTDMAVEKPIDISHSMVLSCQLDGAIEKPITISQVIGLATVPFGSTISPGETSCELSLFVPTILQSADGAMTVVMSLGITQDTSVSAEALLLQQISIGLDVSSLLSGLGALQAVNAMQLFVEPNPTFIHGMGSESPLFCLTSLAVSAIGSCSLSIPLNLSVDGIPTGAFSMQTDQEISLGTSMISAGYGSLALECAMFATQEITLTTTISGSLSIMKEIGMEIEVADGTYYPTVEAIVMASNVSHCAVAFTRQT